jgi:ribosomal protein S12 methylthiotransferase RimO
VPTANTNASIAAADDTADAPRTVALVTLGCARNDVDSEELAGRLTADGWTIVDEPSSASAVVVNTCGFIESAKKDSIDALLAASDLKGSSNVQAVVAVGCFAQRYGEELAEALPEADAVLGFDAYPDLGARLRRIVQGERPASHTPTDRRLILPITPAQRPAAADDVVLPGHAARVGQGGVGEVVRRRLAGGPTAPLKLASGCDRRCAFCAIPAFRGAFVSRPADEVLAEAAWLAEQGVREVVLVSENTTSYGKDLGGTHLLPELLRDLAQVPGLSWIRTSYLQPAEMRPELLSAIARTPGVVPYFDMSFQHASATVLRRMRRFGGTDDFLALIEQMRAAAPECGIRSNVIVGFPGETEDDVRELEEFLVRARLDAVGVFGFSPEDGTEAADLPDHIDPDEVAARVERLTALVDELVSQRAEDRIGQQVAVLIESVNADSAEGRAAHQAPEVDGCATVAWATSNAVQPAVGDIVTGVVESNDGADLIVRLGDFT